MQTKPRTWKFWVSRSIFGLLFIASLWLINLIWFRPFNIRNFYDRVFVEIVLKDPELITTLGIPVLNDLNKNKLTDISVEKETEKLNLLKKDYDLLLSYNYNNQSKANQLNTDILKWYLKSIIDGEPFSDYNYPVNQMSGIQNDLPSFMATAHKLKSNSDIEAYITRLSLFNNKFNQLLTSLKIREEKGIIPPKFVIERVLDEMKGFTGEKNTTSDPVRTNILYTNFVSKISQLETLTNEEKQGYTLKVESEIRSAVFGAYQKLISYLEYLKTKATADDGVWKLPDGDAYYRYRLKLMTTTNLTPEEVHQMGLKEVYRIKKEMRSILKSEGYTDTTQSIGTTMQILSQDERFLYPENDEGREKLMQSYQDILQKANAGLDNAFDLRSKAGIEVKRVPDFRETGQAKAYYQGPKMDGSSKGVFYVNLRKVHEHPTYTMKSLAYHEGIPGHHFQHSLQAELKGTPIFRKVIPFTAYTEGWAMYSEQLAWELGFYDHDPIGNLGRLQSEMWRAVRLVTDTGIHFKKWTREKAIEYMVSNTGLTTSEVTTEIERYIVMPGQACAYKIGMMKILELRERAKTKLGNRFSLKDFHRVVLQNGAVPLEILEKLVDEYIATTSSKYAV
jgi:uncharacterized protein (DUF885 family)